MCGWPSLTAMLNVFQYQSGIKFIVLSIRQSIHTFIDFFMHPPLVDAYDKPSSYLGYTTQNFLKCEILAKCSNSQVHSGLLTPSTRRWDPTTELEGRVRRKLFHFWHQLKGKCIL